MSAAGAHATHEGVVGVSPRIGVPFVVMRTGRVTSRRAGLPICGGLATRGMASSSGTHKSVVV